MIVVEQKPTCPYCKNVGKFKHEVRKGVKVYVYSYYCTRCKRLIEQRKEVIK